MPNWCYVSATFSSENKSRIKKLKKELLNKDDFSYTKLIPEPFKFLTFDADGNLTEYNELNEISVIKNEDITDDIKPFICKDTQRYIHGASMKLNGYTVVDWYSWRVDKYGVKWDVNKETATFYNEDDDNCISVFFESPWTYPKPILDAICKKYKVSCEFSAEECGTGIYDICEIDYDEDEGTITTTLNEYENEIDFFRAFGDQITAYKCSDCDYIYKDDELESDEDIICPSCGSENYTKY